MAVRTASQTISRCQALRNNWVTRNTKFKEWYDILILKDELKQEGMESVVSNDPRTGYNMGKHLLTSSHLAHKIVSEDVDPEAMAGISYLQTFMTKRWGVEDRRYRKAGKKGWMNEFDALMLSTGWYAIFAMADENRLWAEVWHPFEVFPEFGDNELIEVAHIYTLSANAARRKVKEKGWEVNTRYWRGNITIHDHWTFDADGDVANAVVVGSDYAKPPVKDPALSRVGRLPVFVSPVGGLPDRGTIQLGNEWQKHIGESVVAVNEELGKNYNRMLTFSQQIMRDTANSKWLELSTGEQILTPEAMKKHGAIFRGEPGDTVQALSAAPIPIEMRTTIMDYQNMLQRGLFAWAVFGNIQQKMSYLAMANIASSSMQILTPYVSGKKALLTDVDEFWFQMMKENGFRPHGFKMPPDLPKELEFDVQVDIEIPGYLVQRATVARMLDPNFKLSTDTVMGRLFPEIRDTIKEQSKARKDLAMMHPKAILVDQVIAYREQARLLRNANDVASAELYEKLAASLESELEPQQPQPVATTPGEVPITQEVLPKEITEPGAGLGRLT